MIRAINIPKKMVCKVCNFKMGLMSERMNRNWGNKIPFAELYVWKVATYLLSDNNFAIFPHKISQNIILLLIHSRG